MSWKYAIITYKLFVCFSENVFFDHYVLIIAFIETETRWPLLLNNSYFKVTILLCWSPCWGIRLLPNVYPLMMVCSSPLEDWMILGLSSECCNVRKMPFYGLFGWDIFLKTQLKFADFHQFKKISICHLSADCKLTQKSLSDLLSLHA